MVSRPEAIQRLLDLYSAPRYLEIGVDYGNTFTPLKAARKVAVDPKFNFEFSNCPEPGFEVEFHEVTSDTYFAEFVKSSDVFDVIFLDGLHVAEQTIRDLLNAVLFLHPDGVIIIDDVIPNSYHASLASTEDLFIVREFLSRNDVRLLSDQAWMGDVYKLPYFIQMFLQQFSYATIAENHGQTVLWREPRRPKDIVQQSLESIGRLEFKDMVRSFDMLKLQPLDQIIHAIKKNRTNG